MPEPSGQDAILYVQLLNATQGETQTEARRWVFGDFNAKNYEELNSSYAVGSLERTRLTTVMGFFESIGVLVSRGLLNEDVFFDAPLGFGTGAVPVVGRRRRPFRSPQPSRHQAPLRPGWLDRNRRRGAR